MIEAKSRPSLLGVILLMIEDSCPPEAGIFCFQGNILQ